MSPGDEQLGAMHRRPRPLAERWFDPRLNGTGSAAWWTSVKLIIIIMNHAMEVKAPAVT